MNNRLTAALDNQVLRFLVKFCEESPEFEERFGNVFASYQKNHSEVTGSLAGVQNFYSGRWMSPPGFKTRLEAAGFKMRREIVRKSPVLWVEGLRLIKPPEPAAQDTPPTHVDINGTMYAVNMVATIRSIRGFVKAGEDVEMKAIVTFSNAELRHQFVSQEDADRLRTQLGGFL